MIIAIGNEKGGVGKTATAVNIGLGLARKNPSQKILLIDADPQGDTARVLGKRADVGKANTGRYILGEQKPSEAIINASRDEQPRDNVYVMPADNYLSTAKAYLMEDSAIEAQRKNRHSDVATHSAISIASIKIRERVLPLINYFDHIIIDCPPSLDELQMPIYSLANHLVVPARCAGQSLTALANQTQSIRQARQMGMNIKLSLVVPTMFRKGQLVSTRALEMMQENFGKVLTTQIPHSVVMEKAALAGLSAYEYDPKSTVAIAYETVIKRVEKLT